MNEAAPGRDRQHPFQYLVLSLGPGVPRNPIEESDGVQDEVLDLTTTELSERGSDGEDRGPDAVPDDRQPDVAADRLSNGVDRGRDVLLSDLLHRERSHQRRVFWLRRDHVARAVVERPYVEAPIEQVSHQATCGALAPVAIEWNHEGAAGGAGSVQQEHRSVLSDRRFPVSRIALERQA